MREKVDAAIRLLKASGHTVQLQVRGDKGTLWIEVDGCMLASPKEMEELADGVYSFAELVELYRKRQAEEQTS